ncbi:MAG TPA: hypothetical protein VH594_00625, partial [Trebonia sp.]
MTKFSDQLFDDLMREHGPALAGIQVSAARKRHVARPVMLTAGAGGLAAVAAVGTLVAGGAAPAYAVTAHSDGTVTLAVYQKSGIAQANAKLRQVGDGRVVVVPVERGCPRIDSLPKAHVPPGKVTMGIFMTTGGGITVNTHGIPAGDILVVGFRATTKGMAAGSSALTSGPAPKCVSLPKQPPGGTGSGTGTGGAGTVTTGGGQHSGTQTSGPGGGLGPVT